MSPNTTTSDYAYATTLTTTLPTVSSITSQVEKLGENNSALWFFQIEVALDGAGLWEGICVNPETRRTGIAADPSREARIAKAAVVGALGKTQVPHIISCKTVAEILNVLRKIHKPKTQNAKRALRRRLYSQKMKEGASLHQHISALSNIKHELAEVDVMIPDDEYVFIILESLPDSWRDYANILDISTDDTATPQEIITRLTGEEEKRKDTEATSKSRSQEQAFMTTNRKPKPRRTLICYGCKRPGHKEKECPDNDKRNQKNGKPQANACLEEEIEVFIAHVDSDTLVSCMNNSTRSDDFAYDSACSRHLCGDKSLFSSLSPLDVHQAIEVANGENMFTTHVGEVPISTTVNGIEKKLVLKDVLYVPVMKINLLSGPVLRKSGIKVVVEAEGDTPSTCVRDGKVVAELWPKGHYVWLLHNRANISSYISITKESWHARLGHLHYDAIPQMRSITTGMSYEKADDQKEGRCTSCEIGKARRLPFPNQATPVIKRLEKISMDIKGPIDPISYGGARYFLVIGDEYSKYKRTIILKSKHASIVSQHLFQFIAEAERATGDKVKEVHSDNGGEFISSDMTRRLKEMGVRITRTAAETPQQNGTIERFNQTIMNDARTVIAANNLPRELWAEAVCYITFTRNRCYTRTLKNMTPYEAMYGKKADVSRLRPFGCIAFAMVQKSKIKSLDERARKLVFVGYQESQKAYRLLDPVTKSIIISRDVRFWEEKSGGAMFDPISVQNDRGDELDEESPIIITEETTHRLSDNLSQNIQEQRQEVQSLTRRLSERIANQRKATIGANLVVCNAVDIQEPHTFRQAMKSPYAARWRQATDSEFNSLLANGTWDLVELPPNRKAITGKWIFKVKLTPSGAIERFKARWAARGFQQIEGIDFNETFAPVSKFTSIRLILALSCRSNWEVNQFDIETAFQTTEIDDELYIEQPEGYVIPGKEHLVAKLNKGLNGLKQSNREFYRKFARIMKELGFTCINSDQAVFHWSEGEDTVIVATWVDDLLQCGTKCKKQAEVKEHLSRYYKVKELGPISYFLGILVKRDLESGVMQLNQTAYIDSMLERFDMKECKAAFTPMEENAKVTKDGVFLSATEKIRYQQMIGSLMWCMTCTRPDISYVVSVLSRYTASPTEQHMVMAKRAFRYMKGTRNLSIQYSANHPGNGLYAYSDADLGGDIDDSRSTSGYLFYLDGCLISWSAKKQSTAAQSSTESEYTGLSIAAREAIWLKHILEDIGREINNPTTIHGDNQGSLALAKNPVYHARTRHFQGRYHFIRECVEDNVIQLEYCQTDEMIADILTKPLGKTKFEKFRESLCLVITDA